MRKQLRLVTYLCPNHHPHSNLLYALPELLAALSLLHNRAIPMVHKVSFVRLI